MAAVAFQTGMETQLDAIPANTSNSQAASLCIVFGNNSLGTGPADISLSGSSSLAGSVTGQSASLAGSLAPASANGAVVNGYPCFPAFDDATLGNMFLITPDITQSGGGSVVMHRILGNDLPPATTPPVSSPSPVSSSSPVPLPIDIGQAPSTPILGPMAPPESTTAPTIAGSEPPTTVAPISVVSKPDVEGNRGRSQLFDVASSQGSQTDESVASSPLQSPAPPSESVASPIDDSGPSTPVAPLSVAIKSNVEGNHGRSQLFDAAGSQRPQTDESVASLPGAAAETSSTDRDHRALPTASGVDALIRETAREDASSSRAQSNGQTESIFSVGGENGNTVTGLAIAEVSTASVFVDASSTSTQQAARPKSGDAAGKPEGGMVSDPVATASDLAAAGSPAAANVRSKEKVGRPVTAGYSWRTDIVGLAVVAFVGQHLGQRCRQVSPGQPRPINMRRKRPVE